MRVSPEQLHAIEQLDVRIKNIHFRGDASPGELFKGGTGAGERGLGTGPNASTPTPGQQEGDGGPQDAGDYEDEDDSSGVYEYKGKLVVDYVDVDGALSIRPASPLEILQFRLGTANPQERLMTWVTRTKAGGISQEKRGAAMLSDV